MGFWDPSWEKKGFAEKSGEEGEKIDTLAASPAALSASEKISGPQQERGRQRDRRIRRWFNSSVQLRRQFQPPPASLIKYLTSKREQEDLVGSLRLFPPKAWNSSAPLVLWFKWWVYLSFFVLWGKWNRAAGVSSVCLRVGEKCRRCSDGALLFRNCEHQLSVTQILRTRSRLLSQSLHSEARTVQLSRRRNQKNTKWWLEPLWGHAVGHRDGSHAWSQKARRRFECCNWASLPLPPRECHSWRQTSLTI